MTTHKVCASPGAILAAHGGQKLGLALTMAGAIGLVHLPAGFLNPNGIVYTRTKERTLPGAESMTSPKQCTHLDHVHGVTPQTPAGCAECLARGSGWVHLRLCLECGHVGCCDSSPGKHATKHFHRSGHPIVRSLEPGEDWGWCYADEVLLQPAPTAT